MVGIDNNKLIVLLRISWDGLLLCQEHKRKEKAKTVGASLDKKER